MATQDTGITAELATDRVGGRANADGDHIVELQIWARHQRGQEVMPGTAVIALPSRTAAIE